MSEPSHKRRLDINLVLGLLGILIASVSVIVALKANDKAESANKLAADSNRIAMEANGVAQRSNEIALRGNEIALQASHGDIRALRVGRFTLFSGGNCVENGERKLVLYAGSSVLLTNSGGAPTSLVDVQIRVSSLPSMPGSVRIESDHNGSVEAESFPLMLQPGAAKWIGIGFRGIIKVGEGGIAKDDAEFLRDTLRDASATWVLKWADDSETEVVTPANLGVFGIFENPGACSELPEEQPYSHVQTP
jgi:hypothetical protein